MIHQRPQHPQFVIQAQPNRPQSSYSSDNLHWNNVNQQRIVQPVLVQDQMNRNIHTSITSVNKSIDGQKKVLTPDELQTMIVNRKPSQV